MDTEYCLSCGRPRLAGEYDCPAILDEEGTVCGNDIYGHEVSGNIKPALPQSRPVLGILGEVLNLPDGAVAVLYGGKGVGKTTLALAALERPCFISSEMELDDVLRYAGRLGVDLGDHVVKWRRTEAELLEELPEIPLHGDTGDIKDIIFDSLTGTGDPYRAYKALERFCTTTGARALALLQVTTKGEARGGTRILHECQSVVRLEPFRSNARIVVEKTRHGPTGSRAYRLSENGPVKPGIMRRYYSVEGSSSRNLRLVSYPSKKGDYADYYRAVEKSKQEGPGLDLPAPPLAMAALQSALYASGWIEPEDWIARAETALRADIPYFSPVHGLIRESGDLASLSNDDGVS